MATIKTRRDAAEAGESKYYTGRPCINGHSGFRYTSSGICCACNVENARKYNKLMNKKVNEHKQGYFSYPLHPDDFAAAFSYCQALDIQRGVTPRSEVASNAPMELPEWRQKRDAEIANSRQKTIDSFAPKTGEPYMPKM